MANIDFNAFTQDTALGKLEQTPNMNTYNVRLEVGSDTTLTPALAVKLKDTTSKLITVQPCSADNDSIFGFLPLNHKNNGVVVTSTTPTIVTIASWGCIMTMEAGGAINRGSKVTYDVSENQVIASTSGAVNCGIALDKASAEGDLIRVMILVPNIPVAEA